MLNTQSAKLGAGIIAALTITAAPAAAQVPTQQQADTVVVPVYMIGRIDSTTIRVRPTQAGRIKPGQVVVLRHDTIVSPIATTRLAGGVGGAQVLVGLVNDFVEKRRRVPPPPPPTDSVAITVEKILSVKMMEAVVMPREAADIKPSQIILLREKRGD